MPFPQFAEAEVLQLRLYANRQARLFIDGVAAVGSGGAVAVVPVAAGVRKFMMWVGVGVAVRVGVQFGVRVAGACGVTCKGFFALADATWLMPAIRCQGHNMARMPPRKHTACINTGSALELDWFKVPALLPPIH